jgi:hydrogenase large subunit
MAMITVMDPVTRIEGHMKVEVTIDEVGGTQQVVDARCTGTLFRGFEKLLEGRDPKDAPALTQRICGVCPISHSLASVMAFDEAAGGQVPDNGRILRNLTLGSNYLQSHILHFYLLAALDFVKGPLMRPWAPAWDIDMRSGLDSVAKHLTQAIEARRLAHEMGAVFCGRMPSAHSIIPGGFTGTPTTQRIDTFRQHLNTLLDFIQYVYLEDVYSVATVYGDYYQIGKGHGNLLAFGVFDEGNGTKLMNSGYVQNGVKHAFDGTAAQKISESVSFSWYDNADNNRHPAAGVTQPVYPKSGAYSWLKAPRLDTKPYEVGPLARMWVNGDYSKGVSVMDRHAARAYEAMKVGDAMLDWLDQLDPNAPVYGVYDDPVAATGIGLTEAPRGALGHWVGIESGKLKHYQVITPTCWNASPRDDGGVRGPLEAALIGTPVQDPQQPIEALRVIHSFDPCLSCAVHVMQPRGKVTIVRSHGC